MAISPRPARDATPARSLPTAAGRAAKVASTRPRKEAAAAGRSSRGRMSTGILFELLSDGTRRRLLTLLLDEREVCVCRLVDALMQPQPKISRHLAALREAGVLMSRRQRTWVMYRLDPELPGWAMRVLTMLSEGARQESEYAEDVKRLAHAKRCGENSFSNSP